MLIATMNDTGPKVKRDLERSRCTTCTEYFMFIDTLDWILIYIDVLRTDDTPTPR